MGKGDKLIFCFHGYGEDATSFAFLENTLGADYTLVAIDFSFSWQNGLAGRGELFGK